MAKTSFILFFVLLAANSFAGNISGGEIIYDYLGPGSTPTKAKYKITLRIFLNTSTSGAEMPVSGFLGITDNFNDTKVAGSPFRADRTFVTPLSVTPPVKCETDPSPPLNFQMGEFEVVVELPNNYMGYTIAYQGVNREKGFVNVTVIQYEPPDFDKFGGSTFSEYIPGTLTAPVQYNSSARFNTALQSICKSSTISYDFSATDPDGDSLVYSFADAYNGGSATDLSTYHPQKPPFESVFYNAGYKGTEPLGRYVKIDSKTGLITGITPPSAGNFTVCVVVYEFRRSDNKLVGIHRKDITLVIGSCTVIEASLEKTYLNCKDYTFYFSNLVFPPGIQTYDWYFGDGNYSTDANPLYTYSGPGTYQLKLIINKGMACEDSAQAEVKVYPGFDPDFELLGRCKGFPLQFKDKSKADHGVINKWSWDFGDNSTSIQQDPVHTYQVAKDYIVMLSVTSSLGCWGTATKVIKIDNKPDFKMQPIDTLICSVDTLQIAAVGTGKAIWSPDYNISDVNSQSPLVSPDVTTTYRALLTDAFGCTGTDSIKVNVVDRVTQYADYDTTICLTDTVKLRLTSDALYFSWTPNDGSIQNPSVKNPLVFPQVNTSYKVIGKISDKCFAENTVTVKPVPYPKPVADDITVCLGQSAQLNASGGSIYNWSPNLFLSNANIADPLVTNPTVGVTYKLTVRDVLGCPKPVQKNVKLNVIQIKADAGPGDTALVMDQPLQLNAAGGTDYLWLPDNRWLNNINISNPISYPKDNINYIVKVSNAAGCFAYDTIRVKLFKLLPGVYLPNAFTPNNDSRNDYFKPIGIGIKSLDRFSIYNRLGQLIYNSTNRSMGWDGTFKGQKLEGGTFIWIAEATDYTDKKISSKGTVILLK